MAYTYITGSGTQADPYVISDKNGWNEFCTDVNNGNSMVGQFVEIAADIRYNDSDENISNYCRRGIGENTPTIGSSSINFNKTFRGDLNGNNHVISGIRLNGLSASRCVIAISNGAHIHHIRFEKIYTSSNEKSIGIYSHIIQFYACIRVLCKNYINPSDETTHIKENGSYVVLDNIVCSANGANFLTVDTDAFVTLKNILYSSDFISEGNPPSNNGDVLPYYLVEVTGAQNYGIGVTYLNIDKTITENYSEVLKRMMEATDISYIIKDNQKYVRFNTNSFEIKPTISINNCTAYNAFLINPEVVRQESRTETYEIFTYYQYLIRDSVSYFPDSEFYNQRLSTYSEIKPQYLYDFTIHRLKFRVRDQMRGYFLYESNIEDELYCSYYNPELYDEHKPLMDGNVLYVNGIIRVQSDTYYSDNQIYYLDGDVTLPNILKQPAVFVSDMQNTYINSLREIVYEENGRVYSTTDTIPQFINSTNMLFSSELNCYVPAPFIDEYVYWNIRKTTDNYRLFWYDVENSGISHKEFWCQGNIGLIRKGTTVKFGINSVEQYKTNFLKISLTGDSRDISYTTDDTSYELKSYTDVTTSWLIDMDILFNHEMDGNGTQESPYLISNQNQLHGFLYIIHYLGFSHNLKNVKQYFKDTYFKLANDITLQDTDTINSLEEPSDGIFFTCTTDQYDIAYEHPTRDGYYGKFCGILDGDSYMINGLYDQYFHMSSNAVLKNIYFKICNISFFMDTESYYTSYYDENFTAPDAPNILDSYLSGYIDFSITIGRVKRCVIHNLKYYSSGYNMVAIDHYPYNMVDFNNYSQPPEFKEPIVEFSDCLFMENASNILPTSTIGNLYSEYGNPVGRTIYTPCYNMYNNVYVGTYENAIFSPYYISCSARFDENIIMQKDRNAILEKYKKQYATLYINKSSLLRKGRINNCGTLIDDNVWTDESQFKTLDFVNTWKMTPSGPVPKNLNLVTRSITVSCSNISDPMDVGIFRMYDINSGIVISDTSTSLMINPPSHLIFLQWDNGDDRKNPQRSINDNSGECLWITYSMRTNEEYSGGDGTIANPYIISTVDDMEEFLSFEPDIDYDFVSFTMMPYTYYKLTTDLEMNDVSQYDILNPEPYENYTPTRMMFRGEFWGMNHSISGLNPKVLPLPEDIEDVPIIAKGDYFTISPFITHFSGKLENLTIDKVYIPKTENALFCGGIVAFAYAGNNPDITEFINCKFAGVIDQCYHMGLCGGIFAVSADTLNGIVPVNTIMKPSMAPTSLIPMMQFPFFTNSLVYETFIMNIETQRISVNTCKTAGSIRMSSMFNPEEIESSDAFQFLMSTVSSIYRSSIYSWLITKFVSGIGNCCYEQGLPVYIKNCVNGMELTGFICSGIITCMNLHKNTPIFIENTYNTGDIVSTASHPAEQQMPDLKEICIDSGIMTTFTNSYIDIKNCYNNGEIKGYHASGIHSTVPFAIKNSVYTQMFEMMPDVFHLNYHVTNCYNYNNITPISDSEHSYGIEQQLDTSQEWDYPEGFDIKPVSCYSLENTTTDDTNTDVKYLSSEEFKLQSNFTDWDFNNTWISPTTKNRPLLNENLEGDNLFKLKLSVNNQGFGIATGGGLYEENTIVELLAIPFSSYKFEAWSDGNKRNPRNYLVDHNEYIQAIFRFDGYSIRLLDYEGLKRFRDNMKNYIREENDKKVDIVMAGDSDTPVYFNSAGIPTPCTALDLNTSGNAGSATKLETSRNISGVPFDGTTDITLTPSNIGLGNVNNTSDLDKPISNATQNALMLLESDIDKVSYDNITYRMIDDIFNS